MRTLTFGTALLAGRQIESGLLFRRFLGCLRPMNKHPTPSGEAVTSTVAPRVDDFDITGRGDATAWRRTPWLPLTPVGGRLRHRTRAKMLYSKTGVYVLADCADRRLTCTRLSDMSDLYREDVVEFFIWPDTRRPLYLEYEISPLDAELVILVPNRKGRFMGWRPWHYEGGRITRHATSVRGGPRRPGAAVSGWMAEFFIPFSLFVGVANTPPKPGDTWRMNAYRIDYGTGKATQWAWCPATGTNFHDYKHFGVVEFGD
jgi:hypothetical protein